MLFQAKTTYYTRLFVECEILQSLMISNQSLLFIAIAMNDRLVIKKCKPTVCGKAYTDLPNQCVVIITFLCLQSALKGVITDG